MLRGFGAGLRFVWIAAAGHRLRPWRSEYLRWRVETYSGKTAGTLRLRDFLRLLMSEPRQVFRFLLWTGRMRALANGEKA